MCQVCNTAAASAEGAGSSAFEERVVGALNSAAMIVMMSVGHRTGLFDALAGAGAVTSEGLARRAGLNERYVREWLGAMVCAEVVAIEGDGRLYRLPDDHARVLTRSGAMNLAVAAQFIPLAEETGLILPIGQWVLEAACAQLKAWEGNDLTRPLLLAVNVSARQFHQADFVDQVCAALAKFAIDPGRLKLELTESLVLDDIDDTITKMQALKEVGVRFSMDDFGTGYSSLSYLTQLPLNQLKIDQSFVRNIGMKSTDAVIVQTIIGMANNLGMEVIAEGVETEEQRAFLEQHDCPLCQGYLFGKPLPIEEFEARFHQGAAL